MLTIDLATQTVFADLNQRSLDAAFDADFPENGNFHLVTVKGREYWYYNGYDTANGTKSKKYVGPKSDPAINERVERFKRIKDDYRARTDAVRMLKAASLPAPDPLSGALLDALSRAGYFRLRGVLIGTIAFQAYPGIVGARPERHLNTGDIDLALDHGIAGAVDDEAPSLLDAIRQVDPSFRPRPEVHVSDTTAFVNARGYQVEFLVPNRGSDENADRATQLPPLGWVGATPLRFLDFLIRDPIRSVALHGSGVPITIPAPERYAVHKLIVATQRRNPEKIPKDIGQSEFLIEAMSPYQFADLARAWMEAWNRGPKWREALELGRSLLSPSALNCLQDSIARAARIMKFDPGTVGFGGDPALHPSDSNR